MVRGGLPSMPALAECDLQKQCVRWGTKLSTPPLVRSLPQGIPEVPPRQVPDWQGHGGGEGAQAGLRRRTPAHGLQHRSSPERCSRAPRLPAPQERIEERFKQIQFAFETLSGSRPAAITAPHALNTPSLGTPWQQRLTSPASPPSLRLPSDPTKRRVYDSTDGEDVKLPMDCEPGNFFRVRNKRRWMSFDAPRPC